MNAIYYAEPERLAYMPLPDGKADVWLRQNITETTDEDGVSAWSADEVYFRTGLSKEEIEENFDTLFESNGPTTDSDTGAELAAGVTVAERLDALEAAMLELVEVIING